MGTAPPSLPRRHPSSPLPLSAPGVSLCSRSRAWVARLHSEGDVLYSDLVQMRPIMIMFCYLYAPASTSSTSLGKKKIKNRSAANSYRGCRLLAKYLPPPPPPPLCYRCDGRKTKSSFISWRGAPPASRCVQGKQAEHANNTGASEVRGLIGGGEAAPSAAHLLAH